MQIKIDKDNYITGYATVGGIVGGAEISAGAVPADFEEDFWSEKWAYENGQIVRTNVPKPEEPEPAPDPLEQRLEEIEAGMCELAEMLAGGGI